MPDLPEPFLVCDTCRQPLAGENKTCPKTGNSFYLQGCPGQPAGAVLLDDLPDTVADAIRFETGMEVNTDA